VSTPQVVIARNGERSGFVVASIVTGQYRMGLRLVVGQVYRDSKEDAPENWRAWLWPQAGGDMAVTQSCEAVDAGTLDKLSDKLRRRAAKEPWWGEVA